MVCSNVNVFKENNSDGVKLVLICDSEESFVAFQRDNIVKQWNVEKYFVVNSFDEVGKTDLFGETYCSVFNLEQNNIKELTKSLVKLSENPVLAEEILSCGLIVCSTVNRNSTRKLEKIVLDLGGQIVLSKQSSKDKTNPVNSLLNETSLSPVVKSFLREYSGNDYTLVIPIIRTISQLPVEIQKRITIRDLEIRLSGDKGSINPWDVEKEIFTNVNVDESIKQFRRFVKHNSIFVLLGLLKNKAFKNYVVSTLLEQGVSDNIVLAESVGLKPSAYPFKIALAQSRQYGSTKWGEILDKICFVEAQCKGGGKTNPNVLMEVLIVELCLILRR